MSDAPPLPWADRRVGRCLRLVAAVTVTGPTGRVLFDGRPACRRALDPRVAATAVGILRGVVGPGGTGFRAPIGRPLAGRTGTTSSFADAWFTGFTPQLATSVWIGDPRAQVPMRDLLPAGRSSGGPSALSSSTATSWPPCRGSRWPTCPARRPAGRAPTVPHRRCTPQLLAPASGGDGGRLPDERRTDRWPRRPGYQATRPAAAALTAAGGCAPPRS